MRNYRNILFCFFVLYAVGVNAQVGSHRNDFSVGISGGYSLNKVSFTPSIKQKFKGSPQFGFATRYICEKYFTTICGVQLEVNYQNLGWKENIEQNVVNSAGDTIQLAYTRNLHFIEIPLLMQMGWGKERKGFKFLFEAGPVLHYYVGQSENKSDPWNEYNRPNNVVYQYGNDIDNKLSYGIEAGIGVEHSSKIGHFLLEGRYFYGLGDLYDNTKRGYFGRSANGTIEIKLTYLFDIIKTHIDK